MKVGTIVGHAPPVRAFGETTELVSNNVFVGLEIELEGLGSIVPSAHASLQEGGLWTVTDDQSLRNGGKEFIMMERGTGQPLMGADIIRALDQFKVFIDAQEAANKGPVESTRTSIHVHIDARDLEIDELKRFMLLYYTFEDILFRWVGGERRASQYCRPAATHQDVVYRAASLISSASNSGINLDLGNKYDALNFLSLRNLGTIEIRMMRATWDVAIIKQWLNLLLLLRTACKDETLEVDEFPELASANGMEDFLTSIFKDHAGVLLQHATAVDILQGVRLAQEILVLSNALKKGKTVDNFFKDGTTEDLTLVNKFEQKLA